MHITDTIAAHLVVTMVTQVTMDTLTLSCLGPVDVRHTVSV